jgi:predicted transcriptional regulator
MGLHFSHSSGGAGNLHDFQGQKPEVFLSMKKFFYFDPYATGTAVFMGPIEAQLMDSAWQKKNLTVKTALFSLGSEKKLAYTTVMTVLARLAKKGLLQKRKEGRGYVYSPVIEKSTFIKERLQIVFGCMRRNFQKAR